MGDADRSQPKNGHWSLRVSGNQGDRKVTGSLASELRGALEAPAFGLDKFTLDESASGWVAWASGYAEDPAVAKQIVSDVNTVLAAGDYQPGSSEFTSPHLTVVNFHPVAEAAAATGQAAAAKVATAAK